MQIGGDPKGVAVGTDGSIYVALQYDKKVIRIDPSGRVYRFAGKGIKDERGRIEIGRPGVGSPTSTRRQYVAAGNDGTVYIRSIGYDTAPSNGVILRVDENGVLQQYAGRLRGTCGSGGIDGEGATSICLSGSGPIGVDGDGGVTFADGRYMIRKIAPPLPGFDGEGARAAVRRRRRGLRVRPQRAATCAPATGSRGAVLRTFEYDAAKRLVGVVDAFGNRTRIERDAAGKALAIVAPGEKRTRCRSTRAAGSSRSRTPRGRSIRFTYDNGLIKSFRKPAGGTTRFDYDTTGRLVAHHGADGEERTLTREELDGGSRVTITTGGGKKTKYTMQVLDNGDRRRTVEGPTGAKTIVDGARWTA